jgi:hypothetical protein
VPGAPPGSFLPPSKEMATRPSIPPPTGGIVAPEPVPFPDITERGIVEHPPMVPPVDYTNGGAPPPIPPPVQYAVPQPKPILRNGGPPPPPPPGPPPPEDEIPYFDSWEGDNGKRYELPGGEEPLMEEPYHFADRPPPTADLPADIGFLRNRGRR